MRQNTILEGKILDVNFDDPDWMTLTLGDKQGPGIELQLKLTDNDAAWIRKNLSREEIPIRINERATLRLTLDLILKEIGVPTSMTPVPIDNVYRLIKAVQRGEDPREVLKALHKPIIPISDLAPEEPNAPAS